MIGLVDVLVPVLVPGVIYNLFRVLALNVATQSIVNSMNLYGVSHGVFF